MNDQVMNVCKIGQYYDCCAFLMMGINGLECAKNHPAAKELLDKRVEEKSMVALGDNCDGVEDKILQKDK